MAICVLDQLATCLSEGLSTVAIIKKFPTDDFTISPFPFSLHLYPVSIVSEFITPLKENERVDLIAFVSEVLLVELSFSLPVVPVLTPDLHPSLSRDDITVLKFLPLTIFVKALLISLLSPLVPPQVAAMRIFLRVIVPFLILFVLTMFEYQLDWSISTLFLVWKGERGLAHVLIVDLEESLPGLTLDDVPILLSDRLDPF